MGDFLPVELLEHAANTRIEGCHHRAIAVLGYICLRIVAVGTKELDRCLPSERLPGTLVLGVRVVRRIERHECEKGPARHSRRMKSDAASAKISVV